MQHLPFKPFPFLGNPHLQTFVAALFGWGPPAPSSTTFVDLPDGDRLALEISTPPAWTPARATVVLVHGLTGSHRSAYMMRLAGKLYRLGIRAVRFNMRGCGSGEGLARRPYFAGCSADLLQAVEALDSERPVHLAGFSLGGNVVLKLIGELGAEAPQRFERAIAFCPAADLNACYERLSMRKNSLYQRLFLMGMRQSVVLHQRLFPERERPRLPRRLLSIKAFDDLYTAPLWGYADADDYYTRASAAPLLEQIRIPTQLFLAIDDPIIDPQAFLKLNLPPWVQLSLVEGGGHLGFLAHPRQGGVHWMDTKLLEWLDWAPAEAAS